LEDLVVDGRMMIKWILKKQDAAWIGFVWYGSG